MIVRIQTIARMLRRPELFVQACSRKGRLNWMSDEAYLKLVYRMRMGKKLNLQAPRTFNEKLQWLKLYDRKPHYTELVDKYEVRKYIADLLGEEYLIPLLGVWDSAEDIDFESLPQQFVLKCTHDSGSVIICRDKDSFDVNAARAKLARCLKDNGYAFGREWPYKNVRPRVIAEQLMIDESGYELKDYKFLCFNGEPKVMFIATDRHTPHEETKFDFFDMEFQHLPMTNGHPNASREFTRPHSFEEMKRLSALLTAGIPHVRADFYDINGRIYFGELTFSHWSGFVPFDPEEYDVMFGEWITLPEVTKETSEMKK